MAYNIIYNIKLSYQEIPVIKNGTVSRSIHIQLKNRTIIIINSKKVIEKTVGERTMEFETRHLIKNVIKKNELLSLKILKISRKY